MGGKYFWKCGKHNTPLQILPSHTWTNSISLLVAAGENRLQAQAARVQCLTKASLQKPGKSLHKHHSQSEIISLGPWQFQKWYILKTGHWFSFYRHLKSFQYLCRPGDWSLGSLNNRFGFLVHFYHLKKSQKQPILQRSTDHLRTSTQLEGKKRWHLGSANEFLLVCWWSSTSQDGSRVPSLIISISSSLLLVASSSWKTVRRHHHSLGVTERLSWRPSSPK